MSDAVVDELRDLVRERGVDLLEDLQKFRALLTDLCPLERAKRYVIVVALEEGTPRQLRSSAETSTTIGLDRVTAQLRSATGIGETECPWAVDSIAWTMGLVIDAEEVRRATTTPSEEQTAQRAQPTSSAPSQSLRQPPPSVRLSSFAGPSTPSPVSSRSSSSKRTLGVVLVLTGFASLVAAFLVMWLALGRHSSDLAGILGILCFCLLVFIFVKVIPASISKARDPWE